MTTIQPTLDTIEAVVQQLTIATRDTEARPGTNRIQRPLLDQLRSNVVPDGASGGGGKLASERTVINHAALDLYDYVDVQIAIMYQQATDRDPTGSPEQHLTTWLRALAAAGAAGDLTDLQLTVAYEKVDDIRTRIMDLTNPPERRDWPGRCPECGWSHTTIDTPDGQLRKTALVEYVRPWRQELGVRCRKCATVWIGEDALQQLAADLGYPAPKNGASDAD